MKSVGVVHSRLEDRDRLTHRGEHWAIADAAAADLSASASTRAVTERFGGEDPDAWGPGVEGTDGQT